MIKEFSLVSKRRTYSLLYNIQMLFQTADDNCLVQRDGHARSQSEHLYD